MRKYFKKSVIISISVLTVLILVSSATAVNNISKSLLKEEQTKIEDNDVDSIKIKEELLEKFNQFLKDSDSKELTTEFSAIGFIIGVVTWPLAIIIWPIFGFVSSLLSTGDLLQAVADGLFYLFCKGLFWPFRCAEGNIMP